MKHRFTDEQMRRGGCLGILTLYAAALALMAWAMCSCSRTTYVPVESVRTEWRDREVEHIISDTVHNTRVVWIKGDTVVDVRNTQHTRRVEIHDTCFIEYNDTIRIPYPVERKLTRWEQAKMRFGGITMGVMLCVLATAVLWLIKRFRR